ncbi:Hypothetical predicted protein [Mytilus galloprovincialis]|uniref:Uncharacterized protein n=1 Tax=Mytilus galloprovincialis TaxID=29158 RepID=A0A8B6BJN5_MYTGA|nr:Hypothetical predicted protein [Mytilus galloprovincialis]
MINCHWNSDYFYFVDEDLDSCEFDESTINICTQEENISTTTLIDTILGNSEEVEYLRKCKSLAKKNPGNQTFTEQYESAKKTVGFKLLDKYKQMKTKNALQQKTKHILERWDISTEF